MGTIDPEQLARWSGGSWKNGRPEGITGLANDSRSLQPGQLFAALKTGVRDGHDYLESARVAGASGAIVETFREGLSLPQLLVPEVGPALLAAARGYRDTWTAQVIGITGSCGKTTCKEVLSCLLASRPLTRTKGNLNNLIGVPISMLVPNAIESVFAVIEAGISEPGEMEQLARAIDPEVAIVTAIGPAHLQALASVEGVAREKGKLLQQQRLGKAFVGASCEPYLRELGCLGAQVVKPDESLMSEGSYAFAFRGGRTSLRLRLDGSAQEFEYLGSGAGLASNVALALGTAFHLGLSVSELRAGLRSWRPTQMRNEWRHLGSRTVFLDCYNANPLSMEDSLTTFVAESAENEARFYVVGCMEELGEESERLHLELGRTFPLRNEDFLLVIGDEAESVLRGMEELGRSMDRCFKIEQAEDAVERLAGFSGAVFLKGSRRYRLESILAALEGSGTC